MADETEDTKRFTVLKDFWSEEFQSQYLAGLSYNVTPQNAELLKTWIADGRARLGGPASRVVAKGE